MKVMIRRKARNKVTRLLSGRKAITGFITLSQYEHRRKSANEGDGVEDANNFP